MIVKVLSNNMSSVCRSDRDRPRGTFLIMKEKSKDYGGWRDVLELNHPCMHVGGNLLVRGNVGMVRERVDDRCVGSMLLA
jgi:hypothetical protein